MQTWTDLCDRKWSFAAGTKFIQLAVGTNSILNVPAKIWKTGMSRAHLCGDDSSHSQGQSGKGSSWPPEAIPYGLPQIRGLVLTQALRPTPWTRPQTRLGANSSPFRPVYYIMILILICNANFMKCFNLEAHSYW